MEQKGRNLEDLLNSDPASDNIGTLYQQLHHELPALKNYQHSPNFNYTQVINNDSLHYQKPTLPQHLCHKSFQNSLYTDTRTGTTTQKDPAFTKVSIGSILNNDPTPAPTSSIKFMDQFVSHQAAITSQHPNGVSIADMMNTDQDISTVYSKQQAVSPSSISQNTASPEYVESISSPEDGSVFTTINSNEAEEVRKMLTRNMPNSPGPDDFFLFKPLTYDNFEYNHITSIRYIEFTLRDSEQGLKKSMFMIRDPTHFITNIEHIHFIFFNCFILNKGIFFKVAWASEGYKVYICSDCEKKLITCKFIYTDETKKKVLNIERRFEDGCFEHVCELEDIKARYQKVRLGKYKHERNKLLKKKLGQDSTNVNLLIKNLDHNFKLRSKEAEELFKAFKKEKHTIQKFKLNEMLGDDRRLNFYLHITSFVKVLFERYHAQLKTKRFETAKVLTPILITITIEVRLRCSRSEFEECCAMLDLSPRETYRGLITKMKSRTERYLEVRSPQVKEEDRLLVEEIIDLIGKVTI